MLTVKYVKITGNSKVQTKKLRAVAARTHRTDTMHGHGAPCALQEKSRHTSKSKRSDHEDEDRKSASAPAK